VLRSSAAVTISPNPPNLRRTMLRGQRRGAALEVWPSRAYRVQHCSWFRSGTHPSLALRSFPSRSNALPQIAHTSVSHPPPRFDRPITVSLRLLPGGALTRSLFESSSQELFLPAPDVEQGAEPGVALPLFPLALHSSNTGFVVHVRCHTRPRASRDPSFLVSVSRKALVDLHVEECIQHLSYRARSLGLPWTK